MIKYYALIGDEGEPYALIRRNGLTVERFDLTLNEWVFAPNGLRYFNGDNNQAVLVDAKTVKQVTGEFPN